MLLAVSDAVVTGGAGLLGALVGGAVTAFVTLRAEDKRQEFARKEAEAKAADELQRERRAEQAAGRLVLEEVTRCGAALRAAVNTKATLPTDARPLLPMDAWATESKHLAGALPWELWRSVGSAYSIIHLVRIQVTDTGWPPSAQLGEMASRSKRQLTASRPISGPSSADQRRRPKKCSGASAPTAST